MTPPIFYSPVHRGNRIRRFVCRACRDEFTPDDTSPSHLKRNPPGYCSRTCFGKARRKRVIITCSNPNCKKLKEKRQCELKKHPCCDIRCSNEWRTLSGISAGKNNPAWRGGISYRYRGENWDEQRGKLSREINIRANDAGLLKRKYDRKIC